MKNRKIVFNENFTATRLQEHRPQREFAKMNDGFNNTHMHVNKRQAANMKLNEIFIGLFFFTYSCFIDVFYSSNIIIFRECYLTVAFMLINIIVFVYQNLPYNNNHEVCILFK